MKSLCSPPEDTLYRRLGGYDVISAVIDEFLCRRDSSGHTGKVKGWAGFGHYLDNGCLSARPCRVKFFVSNMRGWRNW